MMPVITIPFDYDEKTHPHVVPIAIDANDTNGQPIPRAWIDRGVVPVADPLRKLSARVTGDVWRVSEIVDYVVHSLARRNGENLGAFPELRVLRSAHWYAEDLRVGGRRARRKMDVELFSLTLESLQDSLDMVGQLEAKDKVEKIVEQLDRLGLDEVRAMVPMMLRECDADEFRARFGQSRNTISQRFYRGVRCNGPQFLPA